MAIARYISKSAEGEGGQCPPPLPMSLFTGIMDKLLYGTYTGIPVARHTDLNPANAAHSRFQGIILEKLILLTFLENFFSLAKDNMDISKKNNISRFRFFKSIHNFYGGYFGIYIFIKDNLYRVWCNQIGTVRKRTLFMGLQLMNYRFIQVLHK